MGTVSLTKQTQIAVDQLLPMWQEMTKTEDAAALVARSVIDALLDLRVFAGEFDQLDVKTRTAA